MNCRVCGSQLETIIDLSEQCLGGQFPKIGEPDPPRFPLVLSRCANGCGLIQLRDTVDPELMYRNYWYRSGVTETMRTHLHGIAVEATNLLGRVPRQVLDIGANDNTLLSFIGAESKWAIDPSDVHPYECAARIKGFYPHPDLVGMKFDLIFSIACFYDVNDPVAFARAVRDNLAPGGLWCCEVANTHRMLESGAYDSICHEHVLYLTTGAFANIVQKAGMTIVKIGHNDCNGGSLRFYVSPKPNPYGVPSAEIQFGGPTCGAFAKRVQDASCKLRDWLMPRHKARKIHLLGASTKANTVLQYCGITPDLIQFASDRDPRKAGCCTPGTRIPIISEEDSRAMKPDVYVCLLHGFKQEVIAREQAFLQGGTILFPLPTWDEVKR